MLKVVMAKVIGQVKPSSSKEDLIRKANTAFSEIMALYKAKPRDVTCDDRK